MGKERDPDSGASLSLSYLPTAVTDGMVPSSPARVEGEREGVWFDRWCGAL
jgi:hypothetical protein